MGVEWKNLVILRCDATLVSGSSSVFWRNIYIHTPEVSIICSYHHEDPKSHNFERHVAYKFMMFFLFYHMFWSFMALVR